MHCFWRIRHALAIFSESPSNIAFRVLSLHHKSSQKIIQILKHPALSHLMSRKRNVIVATGLVAFAAAGLSFPFYMASRSSGATPVIDSSKPLPPQATFRGPYINTGSRDIGPDHQTYSKK
ncbi:uncharacterized protein LOC107805003 isoform X2 [Nicotiana tabacum]|uniref:Uncharacterized protein LOC107805003 isoform X2 n=1 Tax=Nicotiana tabacum TaxID=4097 RepID=A0A1S4B6J0_TOBAC|nr:PREDICTED: uncharacterized protein LOC107805003 isoform X2 [Nicotiana tabacum]